jgi:proline iminopeptidase
MRAPLSFVMVLRAMCCVASALSLPGCLDSGDDGLWVPLTVTDDPSLPRFELEDGRLVHLRTFGDPSSPVVIVLHGGPGGDHRDQLHLEALSDTRFVVLWDQRGTGLSERVPDAELDGPTYLADLDHIGRQLSGDRPFALIGHSWGGAYAVYYTQHFPERVDRLVLVEPGALNPEAARRANTGAVDFGSGGLQQTLNTTDYVLLDADARADLFYVVALAGLRPSAPPGEPLLGYRFWRLGYRANVGINTWQGNFGGGGFRFDATAGIDAFQHEVLFVTGEADGRLGDELQRELHAPHFARTRFVHLPDATHSELLRRPEVIEEIRAYLGGAP